MSCWTRVPQRIRELAEIEAQKTLKHVRANGRDPGTTLGDLWTGFVVEAMDAFLAGGEDEVLAWARHRRTLRGKSSDDGTDRDGYNIKAIPENGGYVVVNDDRAEKYRVYEFCPVQGVRLLGEFLQRDIRTIILPDGTVKQGVYREQVR